MPTSNSESGGRSWWRRAGRWWASLPVRRRPAADRQTLAAAAYGGVWDARAEARTRHAGRLDAEAARLGAEDERLQTERAYGEVDLGAQERLAGQARAHRAALRRFRAGAGAGAAPTDLAPAEGGER